MDKIKRMEELVKELNKLNYHYYTLDDPLLSDKEYDLLYDELLALEKDTNTVLQNSPTLRVGGEILDKFEKHRHLSPLYSLEKSRSLEELKEWERRNLRIVEAYNSERGLKTQPFEYVVELKFDGLTINLTYDKGILVQAATRGNGEIGEGILPQVRTINSVPLSIDYKRKIEVQGEGLMSFKSFDAYNEYATKNNLELLKNPRNAAAGALRNLDPKVTKLRNLTAYFYNVNYIEGENFKSDIEMKNFLKAEGFKTDSHTTLVHGIEEALEEIKKIEEVRSDLPVLIDGAVVKINDYATREILGFTNKFPRWAIAFKYEAEEVSTKLLSVNWNVGRSAKVTPTAVLEPVDIGGVTVSRATLNNYDDILRKKVRIGARVLLRRSNDVIPEILGTLPTDDKTYEIKMPTHCPYCGTELIRDGVHFFCPNTLSCEPQLAARLVHFASRDGMNIEGLSDKTVEKLMETVNLKDIPGIYKLKYEDLINVEGFAEKKTENLLKAIENSKNPELFRYIYALGIGNVGIKTARDLANYYGTFDKFKNATYDELINVEDIGPITAESILEFFKDEHIIKSMEELSNVISPKASQVSTVESPFTGKRFVITGTLSKPRGEFEEEIIAMGGKVSSSVSKNTDFVLAGESAGSKLTKAQDLGVTIIDEDEYKRMRGQK